MTHYSQAADFWRAPQPQRASLSPCQQEPHSTFCSPALHTAAGREQSRSKLAKNLVRFCWSIAEARIRSPRASCLPGCFSGGHLLSWGVSVPNREMRCLNRWYVESLWLLCSLLVATHYNHHFTFSLLLSSLSTPSSLCFPLLYIVSYHVPALWKRLRTLWWVIQKKASSVGQFTEYHTCTKNIQPYCGTCAAAHTVYWLFSVMHMPEVQEDLVVLNT